MLAEREMEMDLRAPHAFLPHACLRLAACDTPEPSSRCTDLQQIPSHNNKDAFGTATYFQVIAGTVLFNDCNHRCAIKSKRLDMFATFNEGN